VTLSGITTKKGGPGGQRGEKIRLRRRGSINKAGVDKVLHGIHKQPPLRRKTSNQEEKKILHILERKRAFGKSEKQERSLGGTKNMLVIWERGKTPCKIGEGKVKLAKETKSEGSIRVFRCRSTSHAG